MKFSNSVLHGLAHVIPDEVLRTDQIENELENLYERLKLPVGRLELMTGIKERRLWPAGTSAAQASAQAGLQSLAASGVAPEDIGVLIHAAVSRDHLEPATASFVHQALGLKSDTIVFDLSNACLGFLNGMVMIAGLIESGQVDHGMIVVGENGRPLLERTIKLLQEASLNRKTIKPHFASLTIGCGAAAGILSRSDLADGPKLSSSTTRSDTDHVHLCVGGHSQEPGLEMMTNSEELLVRGVQLAERTWADFTKESGWGRDTPDVIVTHQVGSTHRRALYSSLNLNPEKDFSTFEHLGNIGSAALPLTLSKAISEGRFKRGQRCALLGIGSGIHCSMQSLEW